VADGWVKDEPDALARGEAGWPADWPADWVVVGRVLLVPSVGVIVNTDSIMPATRHTARMLAISGMMPAWPGMIRRSRLRRLRARCSRW
jgi:hypothetical protein